MIIMATLLIAPTDNVRIALADLPAGQLIDLPTGPITLHDPIPAKHKFLTEPLPAGAPVRMYGGLIGRTTQPLPAGARLTTTNLTNATPDYHAWQRAPSWAPPDVSRWAQRTFAGYHRPGGRVGTANHWLVVPLVFCENRNVDLLRDLLLPELGYGKTPRPAGLRELIVAIAAGKKSDTPLSFAATANKHHRPFPNVDGLQFITHEAGCGGTRQDAEVLCRLIAGYIDNPNVAGATVLSLGCQNAEADLLRRFLPADKPVYLLDHQTVGDRDHYLELAIRKTLDGMAYANQFCRQPAPLSKLALGLECGGSDGFSGLSANPALGYVSDLLAALGGTSILAEFPELAGVEQQLINRCVDPRTAARFTDLMQRYATLAESVGSGFKDNPSPGNIRDGLITDAMKSAGAARKGGTSPIVACLDYTEPVTGPGLHLLCTPGNDVESTTGLAASGANLIAFTTGLGTPTGNPIAPVVKISSNSVLAERMPDLIDFDAGTVIRGKQTIAEAGKQLLETMISIASGETVAKAVKHGQDDFIPWRRGVSL